MDYERKCYQCGKKIEKGYYCSDECRDKYYPSEKRIGFNVEMAKKRLKELAKDTPAEPEKVDDIKCSKEQLAYLKEVFSI